MYKLCRTWLLKLWEIVLLLFVYLFFFKKRLEIKKLTSLFFFIENETFVVFSFSFLHSCFICQYENNRSKILFVYFIFPPGAVKADGHPETGSYQSFFPLGGFSILPSHHAGSGFFSILFMSMLVSKSGDWLINLHTVHIFRKAFAAYKQAPIILFFFFFFYVIRSETACESVCVLASLASHPAVSGSALSYCLAKQKIGTDL